MVERSKKNDALIWKHTHRDFKGTVDGVKTIMVFRSGVGSTLCAITDLSDDEYADRLAYAVRKQGL